MKRCTMSKITLILVICFVAVVCSSTATAESRKNAIVLRMATHYSQTHHITQGMKQFEQEVEEKSGGRIDVQIFHSSTIVGDDRQAVELLSDNSVQISHSDCTMIGSVVNDSRWESTSIPYYFGTDVDKVYRLFDEGKAFQTLYDSLEASKNIIIFGTSNGGAATISNTERSIESMADFSGLKIRTPESEPYMQPIALFGANPTPMSFGEIYTSLQQGTIDGVFTSKSAIVEYGFTELCKYHTDLNVFLLIFAYGINADFYNNLEPGLQEIVMTAGGNMIDAIRAGAIEFNASLDDLMAEQGVKVIKPSDEFVDKLKGAVQPYVKQRAAAIPEFMKILDQDIANLY